jgi:hypothetical protein
LNASRGLLRSGVPRFRIWLAVIFSLGAMIGAYLNAQDSEEERKREQFLKTRQTETSPTPSPKKKKARSKATPSPKPKAKAKPKPSETPEPSSSLSPKESPGSTAKAKTVREKTSEGQESSPKPSDTPEISASTKPKKSPSPTAKSKSTKKKSTAKRGATARKKKTARAKTEEAEPEKTLKAKTSTNSGPAPVERPAAPLPRAVAMPTPLPTIAPIEEEPAQVTIEKSGYEKPRGFFARLFGAGGRSSGGSYSYLTRSVRAEIDRAPVMQRRWQFIVVHNSGTRQGNAAAFDYYHRHVRRMQNGLAYHFVIGNGTSTGNGQIEVGDRWRRQINGGHVHSDYLNNIALGICLVGDFNRDQPTHAQLDCCEELIRYLRQRCGKIDNHYAIVKPHREVNPPRWATDCPGDVFPYSWFRRFRD